MSNLEEIFRFHGSKLYVQNLTFRRKRHFHVKFVFEHNETSLNFERKIEVAENFILTI